ncbi:hypothetical protein KR093_003252 [Drosophila rubida]|uniref:LITAF domain-containing protein n=1 Tax=Drosophila rubida TaxID=30044 RepID=A0AAD4PJ85_9MUSC|nr:hypothetical protein KR093_003252 [Drosophila rubida]
MQSKLQHNASISTQYQPEAGAYMQAATHMLPPQPPSYEQATHVQVLQPATATQVIVIQQEAPPTVGPDACFVTCPHCHVRKLTRIEYSPGVRTHCMAGVLCLVGLWCFACLPYCATSCMNAHHFCGNCNKFVGVYNRD